MHVQTRLTGRGDVVSVCLSFIDDCASSNKLLLFSVCHLMVFMPSLQSSVMHTVFSISVHMHRALPLFVFSLFPTLTWTLWFLAASLTLYPTLNRSVFFRASWTSSAAATSSYLKHTKLLVQRTFGAPAEFYGVGRCRATVAWSGHFHPLCLAHVNGALWGKTQ